MRISIFFSWMVLALILMASIQDCNARPTSKKTGTKASSNADSKDATIKPKKPITSRTKTGNGLPHSRKPRAIAADEPEMMMEMAAGDTIKEMDMFFPILNEAIYNFFDTFHAEPQRKPKKNRTTTEQPEEEPTTGEAEEESQ